MKLGNRKTGYIFTALFCLINTIYAQFLNNDFETWSDIQYHTLSLWSTDGNISPYTPAFSESYAAKLEHDTVSGKTAIMMYGGYNDMLGFIGGIPFPEKPDSIKGYFKCHNSMGQPAVLYVALKHNGAKISEDFFLIMPTPDTLQYYAYSFAINYSDSMAIPDSLIIVLTNPNPFDNQQYNGFCIVDDLHFTNTTSSIPNGNFELWNTVSYSEPLFWKTLNSNSAATHGALVQKSGESHTGNFAAAIRNIVNENDTLPGIIKYSLNHTWHSGAMVLEQRYTSLKGHYRFYPVNNDSLTVFVLIYYQDSIIGYAHYASGTHTPAYKMFDVPIFYDPSFIHKPDSAIIIVSAYSNFPKGNSLLYIDDLELVYNTKILINEFMSSNALTIVDNLGNSEDWIEIYNAGHSPVLLNNFSLTDNPTHLDKWRFPFTVLEAGKHLLLFASQHDIPYPVIHTNFKISKEGEHLIVASPTGEICDSIGPVVLYTDISYGRYPNGSEQFGFFNKPTPGKPNIHSSYSGFSEVMPEFSVQRGFYTDSLFLSISSNNSNATIRYTLDGSVPNKNSEVFISPILIRSRAGEPNQISMIDQTSLMFQPPASEVFKSSVVRAKVFIPDTISVRTNTHTFFIDESIFSRFHVPVISLVTDNVNLFDTVRGIYVLGKIYYDWKDENPNDTVTKWKPANYFMRGGKWERPIHVEFFESNGNVGFHQNAGTRIYGGASRMLPQKSLQLKSKEKYDTDEFQYPLFHEHVKTGDGQPLNKYKNIILRNSGNDFGVTFFRDAMMHTLIQHTQLDVMAFQPSIVFINGEFWGVHNIRERMDKYYLSNHYNANVDNIVILEGNAFITNGEIGDNEHYTNLIHYLESNDISEQTHYEYVKTQIDTDNYLDYQTAQIFYNNTDWPGNNIKFWRYKTEQYQPFASYGKDGRWRWLLYDTDFGFGFANGLDAPYYNTLEFATLANGPDWPNPDWSTFLFRTLLLNTEFRNGFINRMADHLNTSFLSHRMLHVIDSTENMYTPFMQENIDRWRYPSSINKWYQNVQVMKHFAMLRPANMAQHIMKKWNINGMYGIVIDVSDSQHGNVRINSVLINERTIGISGEPYPWFGKYFNDIPIELQAIAKPGYTFKMWLPTQQTTEKITISPNQQTNLTAVFEIDTNFQNIKLYINEFMASNSSTIADEYGEHDDWIEIFNASPMSIDIGGYYITDDLGIPAKYKFPEGTQSTVIPSGGFLLIWADGTPEQGPLHTNFKLSASGESIGLYAQDGTTVMDTLSFGTQLTDISFGRYPDGSPYIYLFNIPTPGATNVLTKIEQHEQTQSSFYIYPNPASDELVYLSSVSNIAVYDLFGRIVLYKDNVSDFHVSLLQKGMYIIKTNCDEIVKLIVY